MREKERQGGFVQVKRPVLMARLCESGSGGGMRSVWPGQRTHGLGRRRIESEQKRAGESGVVAEELGGIDGG